jgi:hypothetical protein
MQGALRNITGEFSQNRRTAPRIQVRPLPHQYRPRLIAAGKSEGRRLGYRISGDLDVHP